MPEATITKRFTFEASHELPYHLGKCHDLHGHSYVLEVILTGTVNDDRESDPESGMVLDFDRISSVVKPFIAEYLDHKHLNDTILKNPTAENIALHILQFLLVNLPGADKASDPEVRVRLQETETGWVEVGA